MLHPAVIFCALAAFSAAAPARSYRISDLNDPANQCDYLIICADSLAAGAESLASYRDANTRDRVENPAVVRMSDVITAFPDSALYRDRLRQFILFALDSWDQSPAALLLIGDAVPDTGSLINTSPVPSYTWTYHLTTNADDGWLVTRDGLMEIPIGRLPANSRAEIMTAVNKIRKYEGPDHPRSNRITLAADDEYNPDIGSDFEVYFTQGTEYLAERIAPWFTIKKRYGITYPAVTDTGGRRLPEMTADLTDDINTGLFMLQLYGHGNPEYFMHEKVLGADSLPAHLHNTIFPIINFSGCNTAAFFHTRQTLPEKLIFSENKGCIAAFGATSEMNANSIVHFSAMLHEHLHEPVTDLGDVYLKAWNQGLTSYNRYLVLIGDPALVLPVSTMALDQPDTIKTDSSIIRLSGTTDPIASGTLKGIIWQEQPAKEETLGSGGTVSFIPDPVAIDSFTANITSGYFSYDYGIGVPTESTVYKITLQAQDSYTQALGAVFVRLDDHAGIFSPEPVRQQPLAVSPNPFRGAATFFLPRGESSRIVIYDLQGQLVRSLTPAAGRGAVKWDGRDQTGDMASPGVYHCIMESGGTTRSARLIKSN